MKYFFAKSLIKNQIRLFRLYPTFPTLSDFSDFIRLYPTFFRLLDFFRLSDSTALTQIMKAEGREEFVPGNSRWPGAQEWLVGSIQRGSSSRVRTEQKVELSLSLGPLVLPFLVIHQSSSLVSLILLAPSGALVVIMVYQKAATFSNFSNSSDSKVKVKVKGPNMCYIFEKHGIQGYRI